MIASFFLNEIFSRVILKMISLSIFTNECVHGQLILIFFNPKDCMLYNVTKEKITGA